MKKVDLLEDNIISLVIRYMIPSVLGMLGLSMCIFFDTMFIGRGIGNLGLAALNVGVPIYSLFNGIGLIFGVGGATALAISIGKKRYDSANNIFTFAAITSVFIGLAITILGVLFLEDISLFLGASNETLPLVKDYLGMILTFSIAFIFIQTLSVFVRNDKNPKLVMWAVIASNITNIVLDYVFIFILDMGMMGAALATCIAQIVGISILSLHFIFKKNSIHLRVKNYFYSFKYSKRVIMNGIPSLVMETSAGVVIFIFNVVLVRIGGVIAVSAYSIISNVALIFVAVFNGIAQGMQPIISVNYGAGRMNRVLTTLKIGRRIALSCGILFFIIGIWNPELIVNIFSSDSNELMDITSRGIRSYFIAFIPMGVNIVTIGFLQSIEKSKISTIVSLIRGFILISVVIMIMAYVLGVNGVWFTVPIVEGITLMYSFFILKKDEELYMHNKS